MEAPASHRRANTAPCPASVHRRPQPLAFLAAQLHVFMMIPSTDETLSHWLAHYTALACVRRHPGAGDPSATRARRRDGALLSSASTTPCAAAVPSGPRARRGKRLPALLPADAGHLGRRRRVLPVPEQYGEAGARRGAGVRRHLRHVFRSGSAPTSPSRCCAPRRASPSSSRSSAPFSARRRCRTSTRRTTRRRSSACATAPGARGRLPVHGSRPSSTRRRAAARSTRATSRSCRTSPFWRAPGSNSFIDLAARRRYMSASLPRRSCTRRRPSSSTSTTGAPPARCASRPPAGNAVKRCASWRRKRRTSRSSRSRRTPEDLSGREQSVWRLAPRRSRRVARTK